jgi:DNA replication and repair protein RecF
MLSYIPSVVLSKSNREQMNLGITVDVDEEISIDMIKKIFLNQLKEKQDEDVRRGITTIGPHRDELRFVSNNLDLGIYGSRGQIRTAVMALKLAEVSWLRKQTGEIPVLLLDETLAELDQQRRQDLLGMLAQNSQSILTTTDLGLFDPDFIEKCKVWCIHNGAVGARD